MEFIITFQAKFINAESHKEAYEVGRKLIKNGEVRMKNIEIWDKIHQKTRKKPKKQISKMSNKELLENYNSLRNRIDGIEEGGYDKRDLFLLEEYIIELNKREE